MLLDELEIQVKSREKLTKQELAEITTLTSQAFRQDYTPFLQSFKGSRHILGRYQGKLVSHALWLTRHLQPVDSALLRTAYVEGVATELSLRYQGLASAVMRRLADEVRDYDLAALSTSSSGFYTRLGWQLWRGPLYTRTAQGVKPVPGETAMILLLPNSPSLNLDDPLSVEWREGEIW